MVSERAFNIFVYFDGGIARQFGVRHHRLEGTDQAKLAHLLANIGSDNLNAKRFNFLRTFTANEWLSAQRLEETTHYFEAAFQEYRSPHNPLYCVTSVVDGVPTVEKQIGTGAYRGDEVSKIEGLGAVPDYLVTYMTDGKFRLSDLLGDDYFKAINLLFDNGLYISSAKLLLSCIDTLAFVEHGDVDGNFTKWLEAYVDLKPIGVTAAEVWSFRNSIVHMTNLASRQVLAGKVASISPYVGRPKAMPHIDPRLPKPFNLGNLLEATVNGATKWAGTFTDRDRMIKFIERYDTTVSDSRMAYVPVVGNFSRPTT